MATVPCPKCRKPLEIPKPMPDKIRCNSCGALIKKGKKPGEDDKVPASQAADAVAARRPAPPAKSFPDQKSAPADGIAPRRPRSEPREQYSRSEPREPSSRDVPASSNTGLKVGIALGVLLLLGIGGGVAALMMMGESDKPTVASKPDETKGTKANKPKENDDDTKDGENKEKENKEKENKEKENKEKENKEKENKEKENKEKENKGKENKGKENKSKEADPPTDVPPPDFSKSNKKKAIPEEIQKLIDTPREKLTAEEKDALNKYYVSVGKPAVKDPDPRIVKAVDEGVKYLRTRAPGKDPKFYEGGLNLNHYAPGLAALIGLTMLECDVPPEDPDIQYVATMIRRDAAKLDKTYTIAPAILFMDRLNKPKEEKKNEEGDKGKDKDGAAAGADKDAKVAVKDDKAKKEARKINEEDRKIIEYLALRLINTQLQNGMWEYFGPGFRSPPMKGDVTPELLLDELRKNTYRPRNGGNGDISNTQFAALALWAAKRHDVPVEPALRAMTKSLRSFQAKDGSWGYQYPQGGIHRDTGTCVGLILFSLGHAVESESPGKKRAPVLAEPSIVAGMKYLSKIMHKDWKNQPNKKTPGPLGADSDGDYYFLWSLERLSMILNLREINGVDWHAWGAEIILANQRSDGSWKDTHGVADTCFALLFLKQANLFQDLTEELKKDDLSLLDSGGAQLAMSAGLPARRKDY